MLDEISENSLWDGNTPKYKTRHLLSRQLRQTGKTTREIADILGVSIRTVQRHLGTTPDIDDPSRRLPGNKSKLSEDQLAIVKRVVTAPPSNAGFLVSEWSPNVLNKFISDEFNTTLSREKSRQLLKSLIPADNEKTSNSDLKKKYTDWMQDQDTAVWIIGHLYLGTQNRQAKFKDGKKPFVDDDLLKTPEEIESERIDLNKRAIPQIALCAINIKTDDIRCFFLDPLADIKKQVDKLFVKATNRSRKKQVVFLATRSNIIRKSLETRRYTLTTKSMLLEFCPTGSFVLEKLRLFNRSVLNQFQLLDHSHINGRVERSSKTKEFGKATRDVLSKHFGEISTF